MKILEVTTACASQAQARQLVEKIVPAKLAACANYWKIESQYWWKGKLEKSSEWMVVFKTALKNRKKIEKKLQQIHPYKLPAMIFEEKEAEKKFRKWVESC